MNENVIKCIISDPNGIEERYFVNLNSSQIKFFDWLKEHCILSDEVTLDTHCDINFEDI